MNVGSVNGESTDGDVQSFQQRHTIGQRYAHSLSPTLAARGRGDLVKAFVGPKFSTLRLSTTRTPLKAWTSTSVEAAALRIAVPIPTDLNTPFPQVAFRPGFAEGSYRSVALRGMSAGMPMLWVVDIAWTSIVQGVSRVPTDVDVHRTRDATDVWTSIVRALPATLAGAA